MSTKFLTITSAVKLSNNEIELLLSGMDVKPSADLTVQNLVDPSLLAGVIIKYNGYYLDKSLRHQLEAIVGSLS